MRTTTVRLLAVGSALGLLALVPPAAALAGADDVGAAKAMTRDAGVAVSCSDTEGDDDGSSWAASADEPANMRSGPSTECAILGVLQTSDLADYHCYKSGQNGTWTYLRNDRTGVHGWVWDELLDNAGDDTQGSMVPC